MLLVPAPEIVPQLYQSVPGDIRRPVNGPSRSIPRLGNSVRIQAQRLPCERVTVKVIVQGIFGRALRDNLERVVETEAENFLLQGAHNASQPFGSSYAPIHFLPSRAVIPTGLLQAKTRTRSGQGRLLCFHELTLSTTCHTRTVMRGNYVPIFRRHWRPAPSAAWEPRLRLTGQEKAGRTWKSGVNTGERCWDVCRYS